MKTLRLHIVILSMSCGVLGGLALFLLTAVLLCKGGDPIGPHLSLLGVYLPGYSVSWPGSLVGFIWGFLIGAILGGFFGLLYNKLTDLRQSN